MRINRIFWDITPFCNFKCKHCYSSNKTEKSLNTEQAKKIIDSFAKNNVRWVSLSGREPLLRKDIFILLDYMKSKKIAVDLETNGSLITASVAKKLKKISLLFVQVSLDGPPKIHDLIRGKGAYKKAVKGIKNLIGQAVPVHIASTIMALNCNYLHKMPNIAKKLGAEYYRLRLFIPTYGYEPHKNLMLDAQTYKRVVERMMHAKSNVDIPVETLPFEFLITHKAKKFKLDPPCGAGLCRFALTPDGRVTPCIVLSNIYLAKSLLKVPLKSAIRSKAIRKWLNDVKPMPKECKKCTYFEGCKGGCKAITYGYYRTFNKKNPLCWQTNPAAMAYTLALFKYGNVRMRKESFGYLILDLVSKDTYELNDVAGQILLKCKKWTSIFSLATWLSKRYSLSRSIAIKDISALLDDCKKIGIVDLK